MEMEMETGRDKLSEREWDREGWVQFQSQRINRSCKKISGIFVVMQISTATNNSASFYLAVQFNL